MLAPSIMTLVRADGSGIGLRLRYRATGFEAVSRKSATGAGEPDGPLDKEIEQILQTFDI
jgi:hypothetical protein